MASSNPYPKFSKEWIIADKIGVEGNYVNDPRDLGGATKFGVIQRTADGYKADLQRLFNWSGNVKDFTIAMAFYVYDKEFWTKMRLDDIIKRCPQTADKMFDIGINAGWKTAALWLQTILTTLNNQGKLYADLKPDGMIGNVTIAAFDALLKNRGNKAGRWLVLKALMCKQGNHYIDISVSRDANEAFTAGWLNRLDHNLVDYYQALKTA